MVWHDTKIREYDELIEQSVDEDVLGFSPFTAKRMAQKELRDLDKYAEHIDIE